MSFTVKALSFLDLVEEYVKILRNSLKNENNITPNYWPSLKFVNGLLQRHRLEYNSVTQVEGVRVDAINKHTVTEHIARVQSVMVRYQNHNPKYLFNMDQSDSSFTKTVGRSLRKDVAHKTSRSLVQRGIRVKSDLDRATLMPVVFADGRAYKPCIIFRGKLPHSRHVRGHQQTLHDVLMEC